MAATTFHLFLYLPWELRARVWELSAQSRIVQIQTVEPQDFYDGDSLRIAQNEARWFAVRTPAMLQACREARNLGVYRRCYAKVGRLPEVVPTASRERYVWLNFDLDIIDLGFGEILSIPEHAARSIKRLLLRFSESLANCLPDESRRLLENLEEVRIYCPGQHDLDYMSFCLSIEDYHIDPKDVILLNGITGQTITMFEWYREVKEIFEPHREKWLAKFMADDNSYPDKDLSLIWWWSDRMRSMHGPNWRRAARIDWYTADDASG